MNMFWNLMERSTITSGVIAIVLVVTVCYCAVIGGETPPVLVAALGTVIGFFFSQKATDAKARRLG